MAGNGITASRLAVLNVPASGKENIDSLLSGSKWSLSPQNNKILVSFPFETGIKPVLSTTYPDPSVVNSLSPTPKFRDNVFAALRKWEAVANVKFEKSVDSLSDAGDIRVFLTNKDTIDEASAVGYFPSARPSGGDVILSNKFSNETAPGSYNFEILLHEIGHALGLKHPGNYGGAVRPPYVSPTFDTRAYTVMSYVDDKSLNMYNEGPNLLDIDAIQYLYGANTSYAQGDQDYSLDPNKFKTIWDPNGRNGMVGYLNSVDQNINISERASSYAGGKLTAVIASGTKIYNAAGGSGNDTIVGNELDNVFDGAGGNDTLIGNGGNDTAFYKFSKSNYLVSQSGANFVVEAKGITWEGKDTLINIKYLQFLDGTFRIEDVAIISTPINSIAIAIADQLSVVYLGRGISKSWRDATSGLTAGGAPSALLKAYFEAAITDRAFSISDSAQTVVNKTFQNIFGVAASGFEQDAWAATVSKGHVSRESLPWVIFNSYLGATNVPDTYKIPAQSRIIAVNAFTNAVDSTAEATLGGPGASGAAAARAWLFPIRNQTDAAAKVVAASVTVSALSKTSKSSESLLSEDVVSDSYYFNNLDHGLGVVGIANDHLNFGL